MAFLWSFGGGLFGGILGGIVGRTSGFSEPTLTNLVEGMLYGLLLGAIPSLVVGILGAPACPRNARRFELLGNFLLCALPVFPPVCYLCLLRGCC